MPLLPSNVGPYEVVVAAVLVLLGTGNSEAGAYALGSHLVNGGLSAIPAVLK